MRVRAWLLVIGMAVRERERMRGKRKGRGRGEGKGEGGRDFSSCMYLVVSVVTLLH